MQPNKITKGATFRYHDQPATLTVVWHDDSTVVIRRNGNYARVRVTGLRQLKELTLLPEGTGTRLKHPSEAEVEQHTFERMKITPDDELLPALQAICSWGIDV